MKEEINTRVLNVDYKVALNKFIAEGTKFDIIFLDPPYAEVFLENSLKMITEIDILQSGGIIVAERPAGKALLCEFSGYSRSKDYKYGQTLLTLYRKD